MRRFILLLLALSSMVQAAPNLIVVTLDGVRWQEVFYGADPALINHPDYVDDTESLRQAFWHEDADKRRQKLMPFTWQTLNQQGALLGDRRRGSHMRVANQWVFSYPGYNEVFSGQPDPTINTNASKPNPNVTFVEYLQQRDDFGNNLAVFGSWDVFPAIFNRQRSGLHINAGFQSAHSYALSDKARWLNALQRDIPSPWHNVRLDAFTMGFALDYLAQETPRVTVIALGETDDFAHDGNYAAYLQALKRNDQLLARLWDFLNDHPFYRQQTNLLITTDHGRGNTPEGWPHHGSAEAVKGYMASLKRFSQGIPGSDQVWLAAIGPDIKARGLITTDTPATLSQVPATALTLLGINPHDYNPAVAPPIQELLKP
ncbi:alkaline phosphatase family protein [Aestuariibacter halophilus]|uniref:Alkaline phosphatase family protein n=1 Tax=Fluctibacter halophilus TaxID=226011 RepID=A0ABS8GB06_9ALTE|nr:alkaline phosphatase family protein [Aestuariibacter halophilus]MCC2617774.1 alkaline phosphatase family protein [Aestuariibacter halophilus]